MTDTENPVADTLATMTSISLENSGLSGRELMLARIAALVAVDAPAASYVMNAGAAMDAGVTLEDVQGLLVAVAPIVGTTRVLSASVNLAAGIGFAIALIEEELRGRGGRDLTTFARCPSRSVVDPGDRPPLQGCPNVRAGECPR